MQIKKFILFFGFILFCSGCSRKNIQRKKLVITKTHSCELCSKEAVLPNNHIITVFIHGTKLVSCKILPKFFHSAPGLTQASKLDKKYHLRTIADTLSAADPNNYPAENMYLFGWNGALSFTERAKTAQELYSQLAALINEYEQIHHIRPKIRIITHSHGGNVALNLASLKNESNLIIDELILLACPVQKETSKLVSMPLFKKVFSLYSSTDLLQVADPQGLYCSTCDRSLFSERQFDDCPNLVQVKIKINKRSLLHVDFILVHFLETLPAVIKEINSWHTDNQQSSKPMVNILSIYTRAQN